MEKQGGLMIRESIKSSKEILQRAKELFGLQNYELQEVEGHKGGRNLIYQCKGENEKRFLRISYLTDRSRRDYESEVEFVHYLAENGANVADVLPSVNDSYVEEIIIKEGTLYLSVFEEAVGMQLADNNYQYREGVPLSEYFYNCGKCLGRIHELSKHYSPKHKRHDYTSKYNIEYIKSVIPQQYTPVIHAMETVLAKVSQLEKDANTYGMVHFDYSDGNYMIDYSNGDIHVYDFDNCCYCWYLYDIANLWVHGVGWIRFEADVEKRKSFMNEFFAAVIEGYRGETMITEETLKNLELMIQLVLLENIVDDFETAESEEDYEEGELLYRLRCMEQKIPYMGFFSEIYSANTPFTV